ncbi:hypothetical protein QBC37DRAFT_405292 [Rhypophila decipiens]|uniref:RRM domain-containing protein n=1 Tax=Rhypophila decipiens TaxID=261697 RepID=A0AAN6Y1K7_9PEZI|nr:hypothetical protein QBC37DRAFT_405292 [Rhypophila decipiens]
MSNVVDKVVESAASVVNDVTNALANTSLTTDKAADDKSANDAVLASAAEGRRLYIGNLAYATTEGELKEFFKGYLVESVSIPKNPRTDRPVGYAFVDLSTPTEAERAIAELSGKEILERKVSVQLARKPESNDKAEGANGEGEGTRRRHSTRGGRGRAARGRGGRSRGRGSGDEKKEEGAAEGTAPESAASGEQQPLQDITNEAHADNKDGKHGKGPRPTRERRERGPPADGIPSKNKVMVANLPYDLTEEKLKELFAAYEPSSAKIALRPIPRFMIKKLQARGEPRKGRGFGFVTLASEELQLKAVTEMNGKEIEGREIAVKVAIDSPDKTDEEANAPENEGAGSGAEQQQEATPAQA